MGATTSELRLARLIDERELTRSKHEDKLNEIESREDKSLTDSDAALIKVFREKAADLDIEIRELNAEIEAANKAVEESKAIRRAMAGGTDGVTIDSDGIVYRDFYTYARDYGLSRSDTLAKKWGISDDQRLSMHERLQMLKRVDNTLSSDVGGLQPAQHIAQIFQVINKGRELVAAASRTTLDRGAITYPKVTQRPEVDVQESEKTTGGDRAMNVDMETANASTYHGGGDLSWQAINWSTPDALQLWFDLAAADYALKTETDAAGIVTSSAFTYAIDSPIGATPAFEDLMTAVGDGYAAVFENSGRTANALILAPDVYGYLLGLTSDQFSQFVSVAADRIGPLSILQSRGLDSGVIIVGDVSALLVAETAGAPVELKVVEPAIGGVEVGIIGAFEAVVVDDGAFSLLTDAS